MNTPEKITLRAMEPEDLDLLYQIENDPQLWCVGSATVPYSRYVLHDYIAQTTGDIYTDKQVRLMVETPVGETVGIVDLINFDPRHLRAEVGIVIIDCYRHHGYALAALQALCHYARTTLHLHQLYACIDTDNEASLALFHKAGFDCETALREWIKTTEGYHEVSLLQCFL